MENGLGHDHLREEEINLFNEYNLLKSNAIICNFLAANVKGVIHYSHNNFILRQTLGHWYPSNSSGGVFYFKYAQNISG